MGKQKMPENIAYYRLLMLNLHRIISSSIRLKRIFGDLHQKYNGDYVYGRSFVTRTALDIIDTLDVIIFYLNALSGGQDIGLFHNLDDLKKRINSCFDEGETVDATATVGGRIPVKEDAVSAFLGKIMDYTVTSNLSKEDLRSGRINDMATAHDILIHSYNRVFAILDSLLLSVAAAGRNKSGRAASIIGIPTSYLIKSEKMNIELTFPDKENNNMLHSNPAALRLLDGIYEVQNSTVYMPYVQQNDSGAEIQGMTVYSNETLALYHVPGEFRSIVVANVCEDVGSNHIEMLIGPAEQPDLSLPGCQLVGKLLDWLDFHTVAEYGFSSASIRNMTRSDMENHLNTLGKLLSFVTSTRIAPSDDDSVQRNIDVFLEHIV